MIASQKKPERQKLDKPNILIVDDEVDMLESLSELLTLELPDYHVATAECFDTALEYSNSEPPNLVLLDIKIGDENGLKLIPKLKELNQKISVIMLTAYRNNEYAIEALRQGAVDFLYKPIDPYELCIIIKRNIEKRKLEEQAELSEKQFKAIFEKSSQWFFLCDSNGKIVNVNEAALNKINNTKDSVLGMYLWQAPWWKGSQRAKHILQKGFVQILSGDQFNEEIELNFTDHSPIELEISMKRVSSLFDGNQQVILECRDITKTKTLERELKNVNVNLEKKVAERNKELLKSIFKLEKEIEQRNAAEKSLKLAHEQVCNANNAKSMFISKMSHEFRTPMNAILGFAQLLEIEDSLDEEQKTYVTEILNSGNEMMTLISNLFDLSTLEKQTTEIMRIPISLNEILESCIAELDPLIKSLDITLQNQFDHTKNIMVLGDKKYLRQAFFNLLSNTINFNHKGGLVSIACEDLPGDKVKICIVESAKELISGNNAPVKISDNRNMDIGKGMGVGLAITKYIVEAIGGSISCGTTTQGSTFCVTLDTTKSA